jgi:aspartate kinase
VDNKFNNFDAFYRELQSEFKIDFQKKVDLYTIRHFNDAIVEEISKKGTPLLRQTNKETVQIVLGAN